jgi:hypothetical protein
MLNMKGVQYLANLPIQDPSTGDDYMNLVLGAIFISVSKSTPFRVSCLSLIEPWLTANGHSIDNRCNTT